MVLTRILRSKMSTKKRRNSSNEAAKSNAKAHSASPPKKSRLSSATEIAGNIRSVEAAPSRVRTYRLTPAPLQSFEPHGQQKFFSEGFRPNDGDNGQQKFFSEGLRPNDGNNGQKKFFSEGSRPNDGNEIVTSRDSSPNSFPYSLPPYWFDSEPELPHAVPLADGETTFWKIEHAAFIKSAAGLSNTKWIGVRPLGSGGFGTAGLWELRDEDNAVTQVMPT